MRCAVLVSFALAATGFAHADALHDRVLAESGAGHWKKDFELVEKMQLWDFSEQQVTFPCTLPADFKGADTLKLLAFTDTSVRVIPFQLSGETVSFRTDLPKGAHRLFRLVTGFEAKDVAVDVAKAPTLHDGVLGNGLIDVKVPVGHREFAGGEAMEKVPAPILGLSRDGKDWVAAEKFVASAALKVDLMDAKLVESGPVFARYEIAYRLEGGKSYTTTLELRANESHVAIAERAIGFTSNDNAMLRLDYGKGLLDPDQRLVASLGGTDKGYERYSGAYDRNVSTDDHFRPWPLSTGWMEYDPALDDCQVPRLDFRLGIYMPNTLGVVHAAAFYRDKGNDALLLSVNRLEEWQTAARALWTDYHSVDNLRFYNAPDGSKYMATQIAGAKRFWVAGLIPRNEAVMRAANKVPAGPEVWLSASLGIWNLQAQLDRSMDWDEKLDTPTPPDVAVTNGKPDPKKPIPTTMTYDAYCARFLDTHLCRDLENFAPFFGYLNGRSFPQAYVVYVNSRNQWTPAQRERVRQVLVFFTDYNDGDDYQPSHAMLSGHPNFLLDAKMNVPIGLATFPNHPKAKAWRDSFLSFYDELLDRYERHDVPELNTKGGRWTENIACYWGQSMSSLLNSEISLQSTGGPSLSKNPRIYDLLRWTRDAMTSPQDGQRLVPPQGAHAQAFAPGDAYWKSFFQLCNLLTPKNPQLAQEMKWIESGGKEGARPDLQSILYTDYGPIFRHDFGGANESYAHLQNIYGISYRWGHAGIVYYGAKNKLWSFNGPEANGDDFDWEKVTAMTVGGKGLAITPTDQLLYDFDFAQFYREPGASGDDYRARALMLLRDDYLVISDELKSPDTEAVFRWSNANELPEIHQLKPGAKAEISTYDAASHHRPDDPAKLFNRAIYSGKGDFLTVVAPAAIKAEATPFGATVNGEYIFASQQPQNITQGPATFSGTYGYARAKQLALFQGTKIALDGFTLQREGGDFGVSASASENKITGRIVGRSGGKIAIVPPSGLDPAKAAVTIDGKPIAHTVAQGAIVFPVEIAQKDGNKTYAITFEK